MWGDLEADRHSYDAGGGSPEVEGCFLGLPSRTAVPTNTGLVWGIGGSGGNEAATEGNETAAGGNERATGSRETIMGVENWREDSRSREDSQEAGAIVTICLMSRGR